MTSRSYSKFKFGDLVYIVQLILCVTVFSSCALVPQFSSYKGPQPRPPELEDYYSTRLSYAGFSDQIIEEDDDYRIRRVYIDTEFGPITVDYFQRHEASDDLILVFPVLGGRNLFANYIASYMVEQGFDAAVVHRDKDFKRPEHYWRLEQIFRNNVIRDRVALDFFEREYGKKDFGSFGISRGAINAAATAGVDSRLKYNVLAIGGADLLNLFKDSGERGITKYKRRVLEREGITEEEFYEHLRLSVKTDPKFLAQHIDARNTLMFLSLLDDSVPIKYGIKLRRRIGYPRTMFLVSGHYTTLLFTQFVKILPPFGPICIFPLDFIETEAVAFYFDAFEKDDYSIKHFIYHTLQLPVLAVGKVASWIF